ATQTTVVTTTTTTTTSFPPLVFNSPRSLSERDPKQYPLAASPTPASIRQLSFNLGGRPAFLKESENFKHALEEYKQSQESLQASNGAIHSYPASETMVENPFNPSKPVPSNTDRKRPARSPLPEMSNNRSTSPLVEVSNKRSNSRPANILTQAAEKLAMQRPTKKARMMSDEVSQRRSPRLQENIGEHVVETPVRSSSSRRLSGLHHGHKVQVDGASASDQDRAWRLKGKMARARGTASKVPAPLGTPESGILRLRPRPTESDLEPYVEGEQRTNRLPPPPRPTPLNTLAAQDASLPSPSLSPITAAAQLHPPAENSNDMDSTLDGRFDLDTRSRQESQESEALRSIQMLRSSLKPTGIGIPSTAADFSPNPQLPTPTLMDVPNMVDTFDAMPTDLQTYVMFQLLRRCSKKTLHFVAETVNPALKIDFLGLLPLELSLNICRFLDTKSMCRAAQVSKKWRQIVDTDERAWKDLLDKDGYLMPEGEIDRAIKEGWAWQHPTPTDDYERDLSWYVKPKLEIADSPGSLASYGIADAGEGKVTSSGKKRRAVTSGVRSSKRLKKKEKASSITHETVSMQALERFQGPNTYANAAAVAIPDPKIGLPNLRNLHLFKSIYRRHHLIRRSWMDGESKPYHLAFQAHHRHVVTCLQFDTDKILTGSDDTNIHVYDTKTGARIGTLAGHEGGVWALQYEGNTLVSGSTDRSVRVWDINRGKCLQIFQGHTSTVRCLVILKPTQVGENADGSPIMLPKEPLIITGSRDSTLRVWKLPQPGERSIFQSGPTVNEYDNPYFVRVLAGHNHSVRAIAAHADTLVSGSYDTTVRVWRISTGETIHHLRGHTSKVYSVVLDHERNRCISGSMDNMVKVWSIETGQCLFNLEGHSSLVGLLDLSHGRLVSAAADSTLRIWDPENGQCKSTLSAHTGAITCFQHDGQKVVSGSDRTLKMWDIKTGECVKDLLTDLSGVWQVKFNERRCVAAVQRNRFTYIEVSVLDFGAARDGISEDQLGVRTLVDANGDPMSESPESD
ncbi:WD40 repeat-like protein, partial [Eremomyces bilateralis CBS 781.70]